MVPCTTVPCSSLGDFDLPGEVYTRGVYFCGMAKEQCLSGSPENPRREYALCISSTGKRVPIFDELSRYIEQHALPEADQAFQPDGGLMAVTWTLELTNMSSRLPMMYLRQVVIVGKPRT